MHQAPDRNASQSSLAHGLNNKLSVIVGTCDLVMEKMPEGSPFLRQMSVIRDAAKSMAAEIAQLRGNLQTTRPAKGKHDHGTQSHG